MCVFAVLDLHNIRMNTGVVAFNFFYCTYINFILFVCLS